MFRYTVSLAAAAAALGLTLATTAAIAAPASYEEVGIQVDYADLDLAKAAGAATLYRRIQSAARRACNANGRTLPLHLRERDSECVKQAVAAAVARVDRETLTALHRQRAASGKA